ncbi:MAG: restriction endonuclease subunit S [Bacteroidetes bacterium]|nr:restriction endonuclease subunit S [Bacteroidota bacterium]
MVELGEVCELLNGYAFKSSEYQDHGIRVIRIANVQSGAIVDTDPKYMPEESARELGRFLLKENDILMSLTGNVGRIGRIPRELLPAYVNQRVAKLEVSGTDRLDPGFLYAVLSDPTFEADAMKNATGVAQGNLSSKWVEAYQIPLPPLSEQERIVAELEEERRMVEAAKALVARMEARVKERVERVWGGGSDGQTIRRSDDLKNGSEPKPVSPPYPDRDEEVSMAAEPSPVAERRGPGRPPKHAPATGQGSAEAAIHNWLQAHPGLHARSAILAGTGVAATAWNAAIKQLLEAGQVERQGEKKGARYRGVNEVIQP